MWQATATPPSTSTDNTVTYDSPSDGDDQPGGRSGRPNQRFADQLHGGVQRAGDRLCDWRCDADRHGRATTAVVTGSWHDL